MTDSVLVLSTWRWGYDTWALILPFCATPLIVLMLIIQRRAKENGYIEKKMVKDDRGHSMAQRLARLMQVDFDIVSAMLLVLGLGLTLVPSALTGSKNSDRWQQGSNITMLVVGVVILAFFGRDVKFGARPFVPFRMIRERTIIAACLLSVLDFFHYSVFTIFFPSYLQVAGGFSPGHASRIE